VLHPDLQVSIKVIRTTGDQFAAASLSALAEETKGLFVKEIEEALLAGVIDLAVHSLKDVPTQLPDGLSLEIIPARGEPWDALISNRKIQSLDQLPGGARVGTSSLRRKIQLACRRPDLLITPIRGNVDTRIRKLREGTFDAVILAAAGLSRLELSRLITFRFAVEEMVPAIGQGCLALETREGDAAVLETIQDLDHPLTKKCVTVERVFLEKMGGGCQVPMGAYAFLNQEQSRFSAFVASPDGRQVIKHTFVGNVSDLESLVSEAVDFFRARGGDRLLREVKN
jgi:hydroxymethylbilane synthase